MANWVLICWIMSECGYGGGNCEIFLLLEYWDYCREVFRRVMKFNFSVWIFLTKIRSHFQTFLKVNSFINLNPTKIKSNEYPAKMIFLLAIFKMNSKKLAKKLFFCFNFITEVLPITIITKLFHNENQVQFPAPLQ